LKISVIIPTYNEASQIEKTISYLTSPHIVEIIVADGGSTDNTTEIATNAGAKVINCSQKGRAAQMNEAATMATGPILYFLHADTIPPKSFSTDILQAVAAGYNSGCFQLKFDYLHWFLKLNCWFTRFNLNCFRFGDQSLFVNKQVFLQCGRFNENCIVLEDQEIISRIRKHSKFLVIQKPVITSARKYLCNGIFKTQAVFYLIYALYWLGFSQRILVQVYCKLLRQDKVL